MLFDVAACPQLPKTYSQSQRLPQRAVLRTLVLYSDMCVHLLCYEQLS